jgi:hypothetical protein
MTRFLAVTSALALLAACDAQTPAANEAAPANGASSSQANTSDTLAVDAETAKRLMHERHEGMEDIGDATKAGRRRSRSH